MGLQHSHETAAGRERAAPCLTGLTLTVFWRKERLPPVPDISAATRIPV